MEGCSTSQKHYAWWLRIISYYILSLKKIQGEYGIAVITYILSHRYMYFALSPHFPHFLFAVANTVTNIDLIYTNLMTVLILDDFSMQFPSGLDMH